MPRGRQVYTCRPRLEYTRTVSAREMEGSSSTSMDVERERGITIKACAVHSIIPQKDGEVCRASI